MEEGEKRQWVLFALAVAVGTTFAVVLKDHLHGITSIVAFAVTIGATSGVCALIMMPRKRL